MSAQKSFLILSAIILITSLCSPAEAAEVINIDLNVDGDANTYTGYAGYDGGSDVWRAYYGGTGIAMGSQRSANLADYNEPCMPGTYAAQIWVSDGPDHLWFRDSNESSPGLLNDGFVRTSVPEANIGLWGKDAYQGTFDIYVYGNAAGSFTLHRYGVTTGPNTITGGYAGFVEGINYVVYPAVEVNDPAGGNIFISYTNQISGIQLVSTKQPTIIYDDVNLAAKDYDVAYETNARTGEWQVFGPDIIPADEWSSYGYVAYLDNSEYMEYDIAVDDANEGQYRVYAMVDVRGWDADYLEVSINDIVLGTLSAAYTGTPQLVPTNAVFVNMFEGSHTFKWRLTHTGYFNLSYFVFERVGHTFDCNDIHKYGFNYTGDLNKDCYVDFKDLDIMTNDWLNCYDPEPVVNNPGGVLKTLYIDGVKIGDANLKGLGLIYPYDRLTIGAEGNLFFLFNEYLGGMDEFAIYAGVLSDPCILAHYNARDSSILYTIVVQNDHPLLWLGFEDPCSGNGYTALNSGNIGINGTYVSTGAGTITQTAGINADSTAVMFPGPEPLAAGSCVDIGDGDGDFSSDLNGNVTIELWAKYVDANGFPRFFQHNGNWNIMGGYGLMVAGPNILGVIGGGDTNYVAVSPTIHNGNWHHIVVTYDSTYAPIPTGAYPVEVLADNPVLYLRFEQSPLVDYSGRNCWVGSSPLATVESPPGAMGNAIYLNGGWVAAANQPTEPPLPTDYNDRYAFAPNDITFEMWVKSFPPGEPQMDTYGIFFQQIGTWENEPCAPGMGNCDGQLRILTGSEWWYTGVVTPLDQQWHQMVVTYDEQYGGDPDSMRIQLYKDGTKMAERTYTNEPKAKLGPELSHIFLGAVNDIGYTYFFYAGYMDEFAIYEGILDPNRILAHYLAWQPHNCEELWDRGLGVAGDMDENCEVDFKDFVELALDWATYADPNDPDTWNY